MSDIKKPGEMSKGELQCLVTDLKNQLEEKDKIVKSYRAIKEKSLDLGLGAVIPLKTSKKGIRVPSTVSFRESDQWILCAERLADTAPSNFYMTKGQLYRAAYRVGLFVLCLLYEKEIEDEDIHIGFKYPDPSHRIKLIKDHMMALQQNWWDINTQLVKEEYEYRREIAKGLKSPIEKINELNALEQTHIRLFKPSYEVSVDNVKILDSAFKIANKK